MYQSIINIIGSFTMKEAFHYTCMYIMSINRLSQIYKKSNKHQIINGYHSKEKIFQLK